VIAEPDETLVGTINEDFAIESMAGDVFLLGSTSWRIRRVEKSTVRVEDAKGATPSIPFWLGEAPSRTAELSDEVSVLRRDVEAQLTIGGPEAARAWLEGECGLDAATAGEIVRYLDAVRVALGLLPTSSDLVVERFFDETGGMQLVLHSPLGGRINRALGLLLRKRFCTGFDFELQAAANDDAIVLSLGPQHSFPLEDMHGFLRTGGVREALTHAVIVTPMFGVRWRWNLNRSLVVLRMKGGKKNPPPIQRMEADDVMVAVFPALAQCQDNANGPREIPDHVLVQETLNDCLHEAMDLDALNTLLEALKAGAVRLHFRDTTEPSPLAHEILNGKPYTFLDDAPLEERRTRAVQTRRGLPVAARELSALDLAAIDRVRSEAERAPRDADELHDVLRELCVCRPRDDWRAFYDELAGRGRALEVRLSGVPGDSFWCVTERKHFAVLLYKGATCSPDTALPEKLQALVDAEPIDRELAALEAVRGHLDSLGPVTPAQLEALLALDASTVLAALAQLELRGFALRGAFDPRLPSGTDQYCARRLLARVHAYTHERLRRDIEPVSPQDFMRFLLRFQHVAPGHQLTGSGGVLQAVAQLQGYELAAGAWENEVLAARVERYKPEQLDALCLSGEVCWGRPSKKDQGQPQASATLSRATPITLALRADYGWLALAHTFSAPPASSDAPLRPSTERVLATLRERGALFLNELAAHSSLPLDVLHEALWDGVARGLVTADGFGALRNLLGPNPPAALASSSIRRVGFRHAAPRASSAEGRWALAPSAPVPSADAPLPHIEELAEAAAGQLLARYGVVFRDLVMRDALGCAAGIPYREIAWALRRFEARGLVRGGRFVNGFAGEQFALPEGVELLRSVRRAPHDGKVVRINACDPLNLTGVVLPGPRLPAVRTNVLYLRDGVQVTEDCATTAPPS
jgi:ATP-dependent Lhr-like helicase